jgi:hypothetical protein
MIKSKKKMSILQALKALDKIYDGPGTDYEKHQAAKDIKRQLPVICEGCSHNEFKPDIGLNYCHDLDQFEDDFNRSDLKFYDDCSEFCPTTKEARQREAQYHNYYEAAPAPACNCQRCKQ